METIIIVISFQYAGFTSHSPTSGHGEKGQFSHLESTMINISHCIYHTFPLSVGTLPPSKLHTLPEPRIHSDHYCVDALRIIVCTKTHALSAHTQWYPGLNKIVVMQYTGSGDVDFFPPCNAEMGLSKFVTGGAINCESTVFGYR